VDRVTDEAPAPSHGVYGISVAAELAGAATQSLRLWERHGLLRPTRTEGGTRRYSADDIGRLRRIIGLVGAGVNIAGISRILDVEDHNAHLQSVNDELRAANEGLRAASRQLREETD
jgi:DNA-binding transcriptional MerR regulator